jgi:CRISP-associated protein Cas1
VDADWDGPRHVRFLFTSTRHMSIAHPSNGTNAAAEAEATVATPATARGASGPPSAADTRHLETPPTNTPAETPTSEPARGASGPPGAADTRRLETPPTSGDAPAEYLPARMLNEFVYCPRLYFYEHVEGVFVHNRETVEGALRHSKVDTGKGDLAPADELPADQTIHTRSVTLSSDRYGLIAKLDVIEAADGLVTPVDYKRGSPREDRETGELTLWDADRAQLTVQALVLRDNGYRCEEAVVYYVATKQRVRLTIDQAVVDWTLDMLRQARETAASGRIPPPLVDSPKCPRCSLVGICLPDETTALRLHAPEVLSQRVLFDAGIPRGAVADDRPTAADEVRRLLPARDDLRPLYLSTQGLYVGKTGNVLKVKEKEKVVQEARIGEICQVNLYGNIQLTTQAIQALCEAEVPIAYFSMGGWFYGVTHGLGVRNIYLRREQFRLADVPGFCLRLARALVAGKVRNQRTMLQRNHIEPPAQALAFLKCMQEDAERAESLEELLGLEGNAARTYFQHFAGMIKVDDGEDSRGDDVTVVRSLRERDPRSADGEEKAAADVLPPSGGADVGVPPSGGASPQSVSRKLSGREPRFNFDFVNRNRRPPRDPINALLSLAYSMLAKDLTIVCHAVGFDPYLGFYHQPRYGRASLALDLMEPFRPLIADSAVLSAINTRMVTERDFVRAGNSVALTTDGRKAFFRAYEARMDTLVTHPLFGYRVNYRRVLEIQARLLARVLTGELGVYPVFTTR